MPPKLAPEVFRLTDATLKDGLDLRKIAEQKFGPFQGTIVVGRPVRYFNANNDADSEFAVRRVRTALERAGIGPVEFEYEPVAAAYFYASTLDHDELIVIGDFGGGTSDFSLLRVGPRQRAILGTEGVALAGDGFDFRRSEERRVGEECRS